MDHIDFNNVSVLKLMTHFVGNKLREEGYELSDKDSEVSEATSDHLINYFLSQIKPINYYNFKHTVDIDLNEVYISVRNIFDKKVDFNTESKNLAKLLYEYSSHPKIKPGELNIVLFDDLMIDDEIINAIGIFKSETNVPFIQMKQKEGRYLIDHDFGFELKGIDKGCLVLNIDKEDGYLALVVDNISGDAQYWVNDFLKLKPASDNYNNTKEFLDIAKHFLTKELPKDESISKTEKIDMLNKTVDYFKNNDSFKKGEFENAVLQEEGIIDSFREFDTSYRNNHNLEVIDSFEISDKAVKKQSRKFKSVLKLDKNFHVYIHGDKEKIQRGVEPDGRKFYKIYYDKED